MSRTTRSKRLLWDDDRLRMPRRRDQLADSARQPVYEARLRLAAVKTYGLINAFWGL